MTCNVRWISTAMSEKASATTPSARTRRSFRSLSSVNVACGFHAGDPVHMERTVTLAKENDVAVGVHWGLPDVNGFGRREMKILHRRGALSHALSDRSAAADRVIGGRNHRPSSSSRGALSDARAGRGDRRRHGGCDHQRGRALGPLLAHAAGAPPLLRNRRGRRHPHHPRDLHRPGLPGRRLPDRGARPETPATSPTGSSGSSKTARCAPSTTPTWSSRRRRSCSTAMDPYAGEVVGAMRSTLERMQVAVQPASTLVH